MIDRMKKLILVTGLVVLVAAAATPVYAQISNRIGPMISFTSGDVDETGIGAVAEFGVGQKFSIAPQFLLYFPGNDHNFFELNINGNYYFYNQDVFEIYGMGGLNFAHWSYDTSVGDDSGTEVGLNLGIGSNFQFGKNFVPFAEFRFTIGEFDQFALGLGVKFNLKK